MNDDRIERIWQSGHAGDGGLTRDALSVMLGRSIAPGTRYFRVFVWTHVLVLLAVLVLEGVNLYGYRSNPGWFAVHLGVTAAALAFVSWGIRLTGELGRQDRADLPVAEDVRRRLRFLERDYAGWLWMSAASVVFLALAINCVVDNDGGQYRIHKPLMFYGMQAAMFFGIYALYRVTHAPYVDELRHALYDLENQVLERSGTLQARQERLRPWMGVLVAVLLALVLLGLVLALR